MPAERPTINRMLRNIVRYHHTRRSTRSHTFADVHAGHLLESALHNALKWYTANPKTFLSVLARYDSYITGDFVARLVNDVPLDPRNTMMHILCPNEHIHTVRRWLLNNEGYKDLTEMPNDPAMDWPVMEDDGRCFQRASSAHTFYVRLLAGNDESPLSAIQDMLATAHRCVIGESVLFMAYPTLTLDNVSLVDIHGTSHFPTAFPYLRFQKWPETKEQCHEACYASTILNPGAVHIPIRKKMKLRRFNYFVPGLNGECFHGSDNLILTGTGDHHHSFVCYEAGQDLCKEGNSTVIGFPAETTVEEMDNHIVHRWNERIAAPPTLCRVEHRGPSSPHQDARNAPRAVTRYQLINGIIDFQEHNGVNRQSNPMS
ncbi:hypothetical protein SISNIDRAFT_465868 [Sistotremastrum niveocremeum HHB9708]|uniref:Uncharacterized protein n=1 Tax=Sistotremastrum niveocremeum HHB9708 TaxID=1314777 RepID=A0A164V016_9AGAM|nr:hypothetical protein SISNIDRAFT_465868 [Sistotremastrum niveocremeum HHB9708]